MLSNKFFIRNYPEHCSAIWLPNPKMILISNFFKIFETITLFPVNLFGVLITNVGPTLYKPLTLTDTYSPLFGSISETYLGPTQKSMMEIFYKNSQRLKTIDCFHKKAPIIDAWQGTKYAPEYLKSFKGTELALSYMQLMMLWQIHPLTKIHPYF